MTAALLGNLTAFFYWIVFPCLQDHSQLALSLKISNPFLAYDRSLLSKPGAHSPAAGSVACWELTLIASQCVHFPGWAAVATVTNMYNREINNQTRSLIVLEGRSLRSRYRQGLLLLKPLEEISLPLPVSGGSRHFLLVAASFQTLLMSFHGLLFFLCLSSVCLL